MNFKECPQICIVSRTHNRPNFFRRMSESIKCQTYPYITHIVGYDNDYSFNYSLGYWCEKVEIKSKDKDTKLHPNLYFDLLYKHVGPNSWIVHLDDDCILLWEDSIQTIVNAIERCDEDTLILWKVWLCQMQRSVPSFSFGDAPLLGDIDSNGFAFHSKHIDKSKLTGEPGGVFICIDNLFKTLPKTEWINEALVSNQIGQNYGYGEDKIKKHVQWIDVPALKKKMKEKNGY